VVVSLILASLADKAAEENVGIMPITTNKAML